MLQDKIDHAPRLSLLQRRLIGEGSHRRLSTSVRFDINQESVSQLPDHYCEAIIIEKMPSGVFADPFELQDLLHRGGNLPSTLSSGISTITIVPKALIYISEPSVLHSLHGSICFWGHKFGVAVNSVKPVAC